MFADRHSVEATIQIGVVYRLTCFVCHDRCDLPEQHAMEGEVYRQPPYIYPDGWTRLNGLPLCPKCEPRVKITLDGKQLEYEMHDGEWRAKARQADTTQRCQQIAGISQCELCAGHDGDHAYGKVTR